MDRNKEKEVKKKVISAPRPEADEALKSQVKEAIDESVFENADYVTGDIQPSETTRTTSLDNIVSKERIARSTRNSTKLLKTVGGLDLTGVERYYPALEQGLSDEQVTKRFSEGLFNYTSQKGGKSYLSIFLSNIFTFFNMLMISVAIALIVFGASITKFAFMVIVTINITIGIVQEIRSKRTVEKMKLMTAPTAVVIRDGERRTIPVNEVVLDDIIYVELGKQICSDCVVVKGEAELNESLLTGESVPVKKKQGDMLYSGSFVSGGSCYARVEKVGAANYVEKLTSYAKRYKKPKSELRNSITTIIKAVSCVIVPVATLMLLLGGARGNEHVGRMVSNRSESGRRGKRNDSGGTVSFNFDRARNLGYPPCKKQYARAGSVLYRNARPRKRALSRQNGHDHRRNDERTRRCFRPRQPVGSRNRRDFRQYAHGDRRQQSNRARHSGQVRLL